MKGQRDEIETMACFHDTEAAADTCKKCFGSKRRPLSEPGYVWADGFWHKDKPPSQETIRVVIHPDGSVTNVPKAEAPKTFKANERTRLREQALALAISAASVIYRHGPVTGAMIEGEAEQIARWIADTPLEGQ